MRVAVYFNLHRKCFSIRAMEGPAKGRVVAHADDVILGRVSFRVSEAGRQRVIRERRKNVHAFVEGELKAWAGPHGFATVAGAKAGLPTCGSWDAVDQGMAMLLEKQGLPLSYNPYQDRAFHARGVELRQARYALLSTVMGRRVLV